MSTTKRPGLILTSNGNQFDVANPSADDVDVEVIAHALSNACRFGNQTRSFYSVAQHSVIVSVLVPDFLELPALLHDATEAYLHDLPRPVKALLPEYKVLEARLARVIAKAFQLPKNIFEHPIIKQMDSKLQAMEAQVLMENPAAVYEWCGGRPDQTIFDIDNTFKPMTPLESKRFFLTRYEWLRWGPR
jgi:5'-deoxynucleotidase YfbR-like HD superfamily hydrolase